MATAKDKGTGTAKAKKRSLDASVLAKYLAKYSIEISSGATTKRMAVCLDEHYKKLIETDSLGTHADGSPVGFTRCDCGHGSPDSEPECPFCGDAGEIEESTEASAPIAASKASVDKDGTPLAKSKKNKDKSTPTSTTSETATAVSNKLVDGDESVECEVLSSESAALAVPDGTEELDIVDETSASSGESAAGSEADLDSAVANIRRLEGEAVGNAWDLGRELWDVYRRRLHLTRRNDEGLPRYRKFSSWAELELGMTWVNAKRLIAVAATFDRPMVVAMGPTKAHLLVRAKERADNLPAKEKEKLESKIQEWVDKAVKNEVSFSQLEKEVRPAIEGFTRPAIDGSGKGGARPGSAGSGSKANPVSVDDDSIITVTLEKKPQVIPLFMKGGKTRAKTLAHEPKGWLRLANGVVVEVAIGFDHEGFVQVVLKTQREKT